MAPQREGGNADAAVEPSYLDPLAAPSDGDHHHQACGTSTGSSATQEYNTIVNMHAVDFSHEQSTSTSSSACRRHPITVKGKSFIVEFVEKKGPRQILILMLLLALAFGSIIAVVPAVMTDRYARLYHGYTDPKGCTEWGIEEIKPAECLAASGDAQNAAALENLVSNIFTFITSSMIGSISDERGRRGTF